MLKQPLRPVGIVGYGAYVPRFRLPGSEISRIWTGGSSVSPVREKSVPGLDEDTVTMSIEAARNALARAGIDPPTGRGLGGQRKPPLRRQADRHDCGRGHRRDA